MAGNILYIPYTVILTVGLTVIGFMTRLKKGKRLTKNILFISIPIFVLFQFYFWNLEFNNYVKSFLFPSKSYECENYGEKGGGEVIPLPKRTVFHGKQDGCSPFYTTYINEKYFIDFYQDELDTMKISEVVKRYKYVKKNGYIGFEVILSSGIMVDIYFQSIKESNKGLITVDFKNKTIKP